MRFLFLCAILASVTQGTRAQSSVSTAHATTRATNVSLTPDTTRQSLKAKPTTSVKTIVLDREVFQYTASTRRDPFVSLLTSGELRPLISDLRLTTIAYDPSGRNSVAILRNLETKEQYRVTRGMQLGRMRATRIDQRSITFIIEEYGYNRQETLTLNDPPSSSR